MTWPFLARPSDDPHAVGLLSLRLETTWFSTLEDEGAGHAAESPSSGGSGSGGGSVEAEEWGQAAGGRRGPQQWDEEKAVLFAQVRGVAFMAFMAFIWPLWLRVFHLSLCQYSTCSKCRTTSMVCAVGAAV